MAAPDGTGPKVPMVKPNLMLGLIHAAENTFGVSGHSDDSGSHHPIGTLIILFLPIFANFFPGFEMF